MGILPRVREPEGGSGIGGIMTRSGSTGVKAVGLALAVVCGMLLVAPDAAYARDFSRSHRENTAADKFRRGVSNMTLGVLAIPGQMTTETRKRGWAIGLPLGFVEGLGWFVVTEVVGVWEFLTCPFEFPPEFRPMIDPEYPWHYFREDSTGAGLP